MPAKRVPRATSWGLPTGSGAYRAAGPATVVWPRVPAAVFPPAYPAVLAFGETLGVDGLTTARYTNAVAFALIVVLAFALLGRHVSSPWLVLAGTGIITLSPGL